MSLLNSVKKAGAMLGIAMVLVLAQGARAQTTYYLTGSGTQWYARVGSATGSAILGGNNVATPQVAIEAIKTFANGAAIIIQFGNGTDVVDLGGTNATKIQFNENGTPSWGHITLMGKLTSAGTSTTGIITFSNNVSIDSKAELTGTSYGYMIGNRSTGTVTISDGTVSTTSGRAIFNTSSAGTMNISGGTVSATTGYAIWNDDIGKITVSGNSKITSKNTNISQGTIYLSNYATSTANRIAITGGTVENTAENGNAVYNASLGSVSISGSPTITGRITGDGAGNLTVVSPFTPTATVMLDFPANYSYSLAVTGGANFLSKFALANTTINGVNVSLTTSGSDLILSTTNGYTVAKSGTIYTITKGTGTFTTVQTAVNNIKGQANKVACTIQFGDGSTVLDIGGGSATLITFDGGTSGNDWGLITLTGKLTSASTSTSGIIRLNNGASIDSKAELETTSSGYMIYSFSTKAVNISGGMVKATTGRAIHNGSTGVVNISSGMVQATTGRAVHNDSTGAVNISGGTVQATTGSAVYNYTTGAVNISGGEVKATTGSAIYNYSSGKVIVSGSANVTSANVTATAGTIVLASGGTTADRLEITGGTVENMATNADARAVYNASAGAVSISGGMVQATGAGGYAIWNNNSSGQIKISGGVVKATTGYAVWKANGSIYLTGGLLFGHNAATTGVVNSYNTLTNAMIVAWDNAATTYTAFTSTGIDKLPAGATAQWLIKNGTAGIYYVKAANTGFIPLAVTVTKLPSMGVTFPTASGITYDPAKTLSQVPFVGGTGDGTFAWQSGTIVPTVGNSGYNVVFTPTDADNYDYTGIDLVKVVSLSVAKANPTYTIPTGLTATYGQTLANVTLPSGWSWMDATASVGAAGVQTHKAKFTPTNTDNYNILTDIEVNIAVGKAAGATVAAPVLASKTHNSISITAVAAPANGQAVNYAISATNTAPADATWNTGLLFSGLVPETDYYIFARAAENANYNAGTASASLHKTDAVPIVAPSSSSSNEPTQSSSSSGDATTSSSSGNEPTQSSSSGGDATISSSSGNEPTQSSSSSGGATISSSSGTETTSSSSEGSTPIRHPQIATGNLIVKTTASSIILENLPSNAKVEVYSLQGKQIYSAHPENPKILKIGVQTKGIYIVKTTFGSEKKMLRVVVR